ncbi:hypothetical protein CRE_05817 [Caenorhabditis remanei]|uniref:Uncharacterized protein n=1 Tax=Caenorhabditis remanei TaxID=31234 RepID=E3MNH4_CAERE|nr:hypothetical protein CRE_05817 [Caenorhabditis remanei]
MKFFILFTVLASLFMVSSIFGVPIIGDVGKVSHAYLLTVATVFQTTVSKHAEPLQLCKNPHWCCERENSKTECGKVCC